MSSELKFIRQNLLSDTVLQSFRDAQKEEFSKIPLTLGSETETIKLIVPLAFIIGDIQGGDNISGRSAYYQADTCRICRMCNAAPDVYKSTEVNCCHSLIWK